MAFVYEQTAVLGASTILDNNNGVLRIDNRRQSMNSKLFFSRFHKIKTRTEIKVLRHASLHLPFLYVY